jgi:transcription elongation factor GreA
MDAITMTGEELATVRRELGELESTGRAQVAARIKTAREWGDLKENAEYHAAKNDQAHLETRIAKLREQVRSAVIVELPGSAETVEHGSTVTYTDRKTNRTQTFTIVSLHDAKPAEGALSAGSPVARALIGRRIGDAVEVRTPSGVRVLTVDAIG